MRSRVSVLPFLLLLGCEEPPAEPETSTPPPDPADAQVESGASKAVAPGETKPQGEKKLAYQVPERTQAQMEAELKGACEQAKEQDLPLLIEFSAPWCGDCRKLAEMKQEDVLKTTLERVPHYVVNIGRFDRHEGLLHDFGIRAIANWQVVGTDDCSLPAGEWKRIKGRTLEPRTGKKRVSAGELSEWLEQYFKKT